MDFNFLQALLGQRAPQPPQGPVEQAIASQTPLLQTNSIDNMPGMAPGASPRTLGGSYPGKAAPPANFTQQPAQIPVAAPGPAPGTFGYARDRAFDQAGSDFNQGNYGAAAGSALRGVGAAIPAGVASAYHAVADSAVRPLGTTPAETSPLAHGAQEFVRGLTGAAPASPMLPEFNQQVQQLQPPRPAAFPSNAPMLSGPTNGDVVAASLHAAAPPSNPLVPTYSAGAPTTGNWYDHVNQLLTGHGPAAGHEILAAAKAGTPFAQIAAGIPQLDANERAAHGGALQMGGGQQRGPVQDAVASQRPMSDREAFYQTLPPYMAAAIKTGHFSRDQVTHLLGQVAPQMTHERDPVWVGKNAAANALSSLANLTAHGVTEDRNGNVAVSPWTLRLPADRLKALGADPANGDVTAQLINQYNIHKRVNSIWSQFFNAIIPLMQQGQGQ